MNKVQKRLKAARDLVANGWVQGEYRIYDPDTGERHFSADGAIVAAGLKDLDEPLLPDHTGERTALAVARAAGLKAPPTNWVWSSLASWGDAPYRTHAQVLKAFDDAIALAEEEGA